MRLSSSFSAGISAPSLILSSDIESLLGVRECCSLCFSDSLSGDCSPLATGVESSSIFDTGVDVETPSG